MNGDQGMGSFRDGTREFRIREPVQVVPDDALDRSRTEAFISVQIAYGVESLGPCRANLRFPVAACIARRGDGAWPRPELDTM